MSRWSAPAREGTRRPFLAADLGMRVTLIDDAPDPGGVCLYRGCMPSKALLHVARVLGEAREAESLGHVAFGDSAISTLNAFGPGRNEVVWQAHRRARASDSTAKESSTSRAAPPLSTSAQVSGWHAGGRDSSVTCTSTTRILATGSRPARPAALAVEHDRILDSTGALDVRRVPSSLLVVGGGYIGLELGTVYRGAGLRAVTVVEMTSTLLPGGRR